jgi:CYTH domain-containing protein
MAQEIERKFLVQGDAWREGAQRVLIRQGYLNADGARTVRVRTKGDHAYVTIKGPQVAFTRPEYEYEIPSDDANEILDHLCMRPLIEKWRHLVHFAGMLWEVDEFLNENAGLIVAEVEMRDASQQVELPAWVGQEVTGDFRYTNSNLVKRPFATWNMTT